MAHEVRHRMEHAGSFIPPRLLHPRRARLCLGVGGGLVKGPPANVDRRRRLLAVAESMRNSCWHCGCGISCTEFAFNRLQKAFLSTRQQLAKPSRPGSCVALRCCSEMDDDNGFGSAWEVGTFPKATDRFRSWTSTDFFQPLVDQPGAT